LGMEEIERRVTVLDPLLGNWERFWKKTGLDEDGG